MRPRTPLLLLLLLLLPAPAQATLITGFAQGQVTLDRGSVSGGFPPIYRFGTGEGVFIKFAYDPDELPSSSLGPPRRLDVDLVTSGGYHTSVTSAFSVAAWAVVALDGDNLRISLGLGPQLFTLRFTGGGGSIEYDRDKGSPNEGFVGTLARVPDASGFPVPEPSGVGMAIAGASLAGLWRWRRK